MTGKNSFNNKTTAEQVTEGLQLDGKVIIVTGGNSGLGEETARVLALRGADVIITARKVSAGEETKAMIEAKHPGSKIRVMELDLSSKASVHKFVDQFLALNLPLHILINNAGCMAVDNFTKTVDGREMQFGTNHLGHFLLTNLLLPKLKSSATQSVSRIVVLSSMLHTQPYPEGIRFDKLDSPVGYAPWKAYGQSKLANVLHARELAKRLKAEGVDSVVVNSVHPGAIRTNLVRHISKGFQGFVFGVAYKLVLQWIWKTVPEGAATTCYVATHPAAASVSGKYFDDCNEKAPSAMGQDNDMAAKLWAVSEQLVA